MYCDGITSSPGRQRPFPWGLADLERQSVTLFSTQGLRYRYAAKRRTTRDSKLGPRKRGQSSHVQLICSAGPVYACSQIGRRSDLDAAELFGAHLHQTSTPLSLADVPAATACYDTILDPHLHKSHVLYGTQACAHSAEWSRLPRQSCACAHGALR